jgi:hypothetical protein
MAVVASAVQEAEESPEPVPLAPINPSDLAQGHPPTPAGAAGVPCEV